MNPQHEQEDEDNDSNSIQDPLAHSFPFQEDTEGDVENVTGDAPGEVERPKGTQYISNKPTWWKKLSGSKASKAQRRAMLAMDAYRFQRDPDIPYGQLLSSWDEIFGEPRSKIFLELGCGKGENALALVHQYRDDPQFAIVASEIHHNGLGSLFKRIQYGTEHNQFWTGYTSPSELSFEQVQARDPSELEKPTIGLSRDEWSNETREKPYHSLRVYRGNCMKLVSLNVPDQSVERVLVTFPDPFPKPNEVPWRLFQIETVREFHRVLLRNLGGLCLATDHAGYFAYAQEIVSESDCQWKRLEETDRASWLPAVSVYEEKGWREGRPTYLAVWQALE